MKLTNFILSVFHEIFGGQFEGNGQFGNPSGKQTK